MKISKHGSDRMQQRSIPEQVVALIIAFGTWTRRRGADVYFMTKQARRDLKKHLGASVYAAIKRKLHAYIVMSDSSTVITVAYRLQHIWKA